jgi:cellulose synthase operon protein C
MAGDIHALEIEFAKSPTLEACIPLCEAYLAQKRFMEAMVVCKKGIKSAPQNPHGRVMLARIYAEQGKGPKAQQEIEQALTEIPNNPFLLEVLGKLYLDQGRRDEAVQKLQQALAGDPTLPNARAYLGQLGAAAPAPGAAPPPVAPAAAPMMPPVGRPMPPGAPAMMPPRAAPAFGQPPPRSGGAPAFGHAAMPGAPQSFAQPMPGAAPWGGGAAAAAVAPAAPAAEALPEHRPLEHVSDFFAPDTLGFSSDSSGIETAGPGRLTILGFVPKSTGSLKTTFFIAITVLATAGAVIFYQYKVSKETREINKKYGDLKVALDDDKAVRYRDAVKKGLEILEIDSSHNQTLAAIAYANAVLAVDFKEAEALAQAKTYLARAEQSSTEETEYRVAARGLVAFADKQYDQGIADIKKVADKGGSSPLMELEAFRLMNESKPDDKETQKQMLRLVQSVSSQARIFTYLGWYHYERDDWAAADKNFTSALQNVKGHPAALLGQALVDLDRGIALSERQKEVETNIKRVLALPPEELPPTTTALAYFARGQLHLFQDKMPEAKGDYDQAFKLDRDNAMFYYRLGSSLLKFGMPPQAVDNLRKATARQPNNVRYLKRFAEAQIKAKDFAGAKATLERAAQIAPADVELKILEGDRLRADKKWGDAIAAYKKVTREEGGIPFSNAQVGISAALRDSGKKADAVKHMTDVLEKAPVGIDPPTTAKLWCELGQNLEATKEIDRAMEVISSGLDAFRYYAPCNFYACRAMGRDPEGIEYCKAYIALEPRGEFAAEAKRRIGK